jgi:hypothetical protein
MVECVWNLMAHGDAGEGKWRGNWRMEWVASTLTLPRNVAYPALLPWMRTPRLPAVDWTDAPVDLNGLVRFGERRNLVSARVPSRFKRSLLSYLKEITAQWDQHSVSTCASVQATERERERKTVYPSSQLLTQRANLHQIWYATTGSYELVIFTSYT